MYNSSYRSLCQCTFCQKVHIKRVALTAQKSSTYRGVLHVSEHCFAELSISRILRNRGQTRVVFPRHQDKWSKHQVRPGQTCEYLTQLGDKMIVNIKIRTHLDILSIPQSEGKHVKTFRLGGIIGCKEQTSQLLYHRQLRIIKSMLLEERN